MKEEALNPAPLWMILAVGNGLNVAVTACAVFAEVTLGAGMAVAIIGGLAVMLGTSLVLAFVFRLQYAWGPHFVLLGCIIITLNAVALHLAGDYHYLRYATIHRNVTAAGAAAKTGRNAGFYFKSERPLRGLAGGSRAFYHHSKSDVGYYHYCLAPVMDPAAKGGEAPVWAVCSGRDARADGGYARFALERCAALWERPGGGVVELVAYDGYREAVDDAARRHGLTVPKNPVYVTWVPSIEGEIRRRKGYRDAMFLAGLAAWNALVILGRLARRLFSGA
ncbi:MAG: hypothetical protein JXA20_09290 [Spirochaetes bacterium]|nr:hypothetical protein [Spirochaetota bacterium]